MIKIIVNFINDPVVHMYLIYLWQLFLAIMLGSLIGRNRETLNRPAGLRTHILVCVASTLITMANYHSVNQFGIGNMDPHRLSAQVISGLGFLGAGTIIKEGVNVKGLTTAASLWAVGIIGITIGTGFYFGAIIGTLLIYVSLTFFSKFELNLTSKIPIEISLHDEHIIPNIMKKLDEHSILVYSSETRIEEKSCYCEYYLSLPKGKSINSIISELSLIMGVEYVALQGER